MNNTIILLEGKANLTRREYKKFAKGDTIWAMIVTQRNWKDGTLNK